MFSHCKMIFYGKWEMLKLKTQVPYVQISNFNAMILKYKQIKIDNENLKIY